MTKIVVTSENCKEGSLGEVLDVRDGFARGLVAAGLAVYLPSLGPDDAIQEPAAAGPEGASGEAESPVRSPVEEVPFEAAEAATDPGEG